MKKLITLSNLTTNPFSKGFIILFFSLMNIGLIVETLEEMKIRKAKLKAIKRDEKEKEK